MSEHLTRTALYELVWSEPMTTLAARFGISDVALKKVCTKADIPVPPRGYWAKYRAGRRTTRAPLPPRAPGMDEEIAIGRQRHYGLGWTEQELLGPLPVSPSFDEPIEAVRERARKAIGRAKVPRDLSTPHPAIARLLRTDEKRKEEARNSPFALSWRRPLFDTPLERRKLRILSGLFSALARMGGRGSIGPSETERIVVSVHRQHVYLRFTTVPARRRTSSAKVAAERPSNRLQLSILSGSDERVVVSWQDGEAGRLESRLGDIAAEILTTAERSYRDGCVRRYQWRVERKTQLEEEARRLQAEAERKEHERLTALAQARVDRLLAHASALRQASDIRAYVDAVQAGAGTRVDPAALGRWCAWARAEADRIDPVRSGAFLADFSAAADDPQV